MSREIALQKLHELRDYLQQYHESLKVDMERIQSLTLDALAALELTEEAREKQEQVIATLQLEFSGCGFVAHRDNSPGFHVILPEAFARTEIDTLMERINARVKELMGEG